MFKNYEQMVFMKSFACLNGLFRTKWSINNVRGDEIVRSHSLIIGGDGGQEPNGIV